MNLKGLKYLYLFEKSYNKKDDKKIELFFDWGLKILIELLMKFKALRCGQRNKKVFKFRWLERDRR